MKPLFILLFCAAALTNVIACARGCQLPRRIAKVLLMPLLLAIYLTCARQVQAWVIPALLLGWIGDLFLIAPHQGLPRTLGIASFLLGHICWFLAMVRQFPIAPALWGRIAAPLVFLAAAALIYRSLYPLLPREMKITGGVYIGVLAAMGATAGLVLLSGCPGGWALLLGELLFLVSDTILCRQFFTVGDPCPRYDTAVMSTYILAQTLLAVGFCI